MSEPPLPANLPVAPAVITYENIVPAPEASPQVTYLSIELETKQADLDNAILQNDDLRNNIQRRAIWGNRIFGIMVGWLLIVVALVIAQGAGFKGFHLDNSVLIAFIGSTTVDVLGLGYIVVNYLFVKP